MPVLLSVALTAAFGTTAPDGSVTAPLIAPRNVCAFAATPSDKTTRIAKTRRFIISTPPSSRSNYNRQHPRSPTRSGHAWKTEIHREAIWPTIRIPLHDRNLLLKFRTSPPGPARPSLLQKYRYTLKPTM